MIDTWTDAFTIVGGFAATALTVVTIHNSKASKETMIPLTSDDKKELIELINKDKKDFTDSLHKILASYNELKVYFTEMRKDIDHFSSNFGNKLDEMARHAEKDHEEVKKITLILYPLFKPEIEDRLRRFGGLQEDH